LFRKFLRNSRHLGEQDSRRSDRRHRLISTFVSESLLTNSRPYYRDSHNFPTDYFTSSSETPQEFPFSASRNAIGNFLAYLQNIPIKAINDGKVALSPCHGFSVILGHFECGTKSSHFIFVSYHNTLILLPVRKYP